MSVPLRFYFNMKWRMVTLLIFGILFVIFLMTVFILLSEAFQLPLSILSFSLMIVSILSLYQFVRTLLVPTLEISSNEVVLVRFTKRTLDMKDIQELSIIGSEVRMSYKWKDRPEQLQFKVRGDSHQYQIIKKS